MSIMEEADQSVAPGDPTPSPDCDHQITLGFVCDQAATFSVTSDVSETVEALNKFARQKPGGTFDPIFRSSSSCLLCSRGAVCLGSFCLGQEPNRYSTTCQESRSPTMAVENSSSIPGLSGQAHLSTLIDLKFRNTSYKAIPVSSAYPAIGEIFGWKKEPPRKKFIHPKQILTDNRKILTKTKRSDHDPTSNNCSTKVYDRKVLQSFLLKCGAKAKKSKLTPSPLYPPNTLTSGHPKASPVPSLKLKTQQQFSGQGKPTVRSSRNRKKSVRSNVKFNPMLLRSVLLPYKRGLLLTELEREYRGTTGTNIPFRMLGYSSLLSLVQDMQDVLTLQTLESGHQVVYATSERSAQDMAEVIYCQKDNVEGYNKYTDSVLSGQGRIVERQVVTMNGEVSAAMKQKLYMLFSKFPTGLLSSELRMKYRQLHGEYLDPLSLAQSSVLELCYQVPDILYIKRLDQGSDCLLLPVKSGLYGDILDTSDNNLSSFTAPCCEILRTSPSKEIHDSLEPSPIRSRSRGHVYRTPEKDQRLQCRNSDCGEWFTTRSSRIRHESVYCKYLPGHSDVTLETENFVPSHVDLHLDPLQCRSSDCLKKFGSERARKHHEQNKHRMFEKRGRTVSPICFVFPEPEPSSIHRPQSCPAPQINEQFLTPDRPHKRRRKSAVSRSPSLLDSPILSPCFSPTSPLPIPSPTLTPNTSDISSSETDSETSVVSDSVSLICSSCLVHFKSRRCMKQHRCIFHYNPGTCKKNNINIVALKPPRNIKETRNILQQICQEDLVKLCMLQDWCIPGIYPFVFPHNIRSGSIGPVPLLESHTASNKSTNLLNKMLQIEPEIKLPKHIVVQDEEAGVTAYLTANVLTPATGTFKIHETTDHYIVSHAHKPETKNKDTIADPNNPSEDSDSDECNDFDKDTDSESDLSDVLYACQGPQPPWEINSGIPGLDDTPDQVGNEARDGDGPCDTDDDHGDESGDHRSHFGGGGGDGGGDDSDRDEDDSDRDNRDGDENVDDEGIDTENPEDPNMFLSQQYLALLPPDFHPGIDGLGARSIQQRGAASYFRQPWLFPDECIQTLVRHTKHQFFKLVLASVGAKSRNSKLNIFAEVFLLLLKLCHPISFDFLVVLFALPSTNSATNIFYRQLVYQYRTNSNIPTIIRNGATDMQELDKLLHTSYTRTPLFFKHLLAKFEDPSGRNRIPVGLNMDATYVDIQGSEDIESQKYFYYPPRSNHTVKILNLTDFSSKIVGLLPVASSQSPSSGDSLLIAKHIELEDGSDAGMYVRSLLRGNDQYFVVAVTDAGFVIFPPNAPVQARGSTSVTLADVCRQEGALLLHTSNKHERYHLVETPEGKLRQVPHTPGKPTLDQNVVKFSRLLRKIQEQIHAALKGMFSILDKRHLYNTVLLPLTPSMLRRYHLHEEMFKNMPKLSYIVTVCCSLLNAVHPGFSPAYMDPAQQQRSATILLKRLFLENPLIHPEIWPISFIGTQRGTAWIELSFRDLINNDVIDFPKLPRDMINPVAIELTSGPHSLQRADSLLTYMHQLLIKDENLSREEAIQRLQNFPYDWKVQYMDIQSPPDFLPSQDRPRWCPDWWDEDRFGQWHDLRLVRCQIPPSYKSATSRNNFHWTVIGFGTEPSNRMGLRYPYNRIYFWCCFRCPALNGSMGMDRHLAALLKALSFPEEYKCTAKPSNVLNTVVGSRRQSTHILPLVPSADLPSRVTRRSKNTRSIYSGRANPIYNLNIPASEANPSSSSLVTDTSRHSSHSHPSDIDSDGNEATNNTFGPIDNISPATLDIEVDIPAPSPPSLETVHRADVAQGDGAGEERQDHSSSSIITDVLSLSPVSDPQGSSTALQSVRGRSRARRGPGALLDRYIASLDSRGIYQIPDFPRTQSNSHRFDVTNVQNPGLLNDGNICSLISILLCLHRLGIKDHLIDPDFCFDANGSPDYPSLILHKILSAMPSSAPFSIQLLILSWNKAGRRPNIYPGMVDVPAVAEALISNMQVKRYATRCPVMSSYLATFRCNSCGKNHVKVQYCEGLLQVYIPLLQLPAGNQPANIPRLLASYLDESFATRCTDQACRQIIPDAKIETEVGQYTILSVNRFDLDNPGEKRRNRLELTNADTSLTGCGLLGQLVSCICHRGSINTGHFVSYHRVNNQWYLNDDSQPCQIAENPFSETVPDSQTIEMLFFENI